MLSFKWATILVVLKVLVFLPSYKTSALQMLQLTKYRSSLVIMYRRTTVIMLNKMRHGYIFVL